MWQNCNTNNNMAWKIKILALFTILISSAAYGQTPKQELKKNLRFSASNFLAYPGPQQQKLTPPPAHQRPFYISHYGRHGSRHHTKYEDYDYAIRTLERGKRHHVLTPLGEDVLHRIERMKDEAFEKIGELTPLGASQHRDIAQRMVERFPEVFTEETTVDARSTLIVRCIMSMTNALLRMQQLKPDLNIHIEASQSDLHFLSYNDKNLSAVVATPENRELYDQYCQKHSSWQRVVGTLYSDTTYVNRYVNGERLNYYLFRLASNLQSTELRHEMTLYDLFTDKEIYENWRKENAFWYLSYGFSPLNGAEQPYSQRYLLRQIIHDADSCISLTHPSVNLRFGHDTMLLPLVCLMGINGYDLSTTDLEQLERRGWIDYRVFPMAANLQLVFYRKDVTDRDVIFKVLLNENEATLPIKTDIAPYYHWNDFREYYLKMINDFEASHQTD